jgi:NADH-quinone oxidoreductase subunit M
LSQWSACIVAGPPPSNITTADAVAIEQPCEPVTWPEKTGALLLVAATLLIGLKPDLVLDWVTPSLQSPLLQAIWQGGGR